MHDYVFNIISAIILNQHINSSKENYPKPELIKIETLKKFNKFMREQNKPILILQPDWEKNRSNKTIIVLDEELKFNDIESLEDAKIPTRKCSRCKIRDTEDYSIFWSEKNRKIICKTCDEELRKDRRLKQLKQFQKNLLDFYRKKHCKYITFKETWKYFYKQFKMSKFDFNSKFIEFMTNQLFKTHITLFNSPEDVGSYADIYLEWNNTEHYRYKEGNKFSLWTIEGMGKK